MTDEAIIILGLGLATALAAALVLWELGELDDKENP